MCQPARASRAGRRPRRFRRIGSCALLSSSPQRHLSLPVSLGIVRRSASMRLPNERNRRPARCLMHGEQRRCRVSYRVVYQVPCRMTSGMGSIHALATLRKGMVYFSGVFTQMILRRGSIAFIQHSRAFAAPHPPQTRTPRATVCERLYHLLRLQPHHPLKLQGSLGYVVSL